MEFDVLRQVWPEWQIGKRIGGGAYGVVYEAKRNEYDIENNAAIKIISIPASESEVDTLRSEGFDMQFTRTHFQSIVNDFVNEIKIMLSLEGRDNIVSVKDYKVIEKEGEFGWYIFILMELLIPFAVYTSDHKLDEKEVIKLGCDICTALETCAEEKIIHRDIKPGNILVHKSGAFKLGDFGIARKLENMTGGLSQRYTPKYMAPEVATSRYYDERVDIYSLGIVLYELLNGRCIPFQEKKQIYSYTDIEDAVRRRKDGKEKIPAPCDASPAMADLILRACEHEPDMRFSSATEMKQALMSVANGTYQIGASNLDKTTSVRKAADSYDRTTSVCKAPVASNQKSAPAVNTFGSVPKKKRRTPAVIAAVLAVVLLVGVGIFAVPKLLEGNDSTEPRETSGQTTSETVDHSKFDEEQIASIISEAETLASEEDYEGALAKVNAGLVTYPKSENLKNKSEEYTTALNAKIKATTLAEAATFAEAGDYAAAMALIKNAQDTYGDDLDYQNAYDKYNNEHNSKIKDDVILQADKLAKNGDYLGAYNKINEAISIIGNDSFLLSKSSEYEELYIEKTLDDVDAATNSRNYDDAISVLNNAIKLFPSNNELKEKLTIVKDNQPVSLATLTPINGGWEWNKGTPTDPFGVTHTNVSNFKILDWPDCSAEYRLYGKYSYITGSLVPYKDIINDGYSQMKIYADDQLVYTSNPIERKTDLFDFSVDISGADYIRIDLNIDYQYSWSSSLILMDVQLWTE